MLFERYLPDLDGSVKRIVLDSRKKDYFYPLSLGMLPNLILEFMSGVDFRSNHKFNWQKNNYYIEAWVLDARSSLIRIDYKIEHMCNLAKKIDSFLANCK